MAIFTIKDTIPCYVSFVYRVEAESSEEAHDKFIESQAEFVREEVGEAVDWIEHSGVKVEKGEPEASHKESAPSLALVGAIRGILSDMDSELSERSRALLRRVLIETTGLPGCDSYSPDLQAEKAVDRALCIACFNSATEHPISELSEAG